MEIRANSRVSVSDARSHLSKLIDRVELGGTIVITRYRRPVARLLPCERAVDRQHVREAVDGLLLFWGPKLPKGLTIKRLLRAGRS